MNFLVLLLSSIFRFLSFDWGELELDSKFHIDFPCFRFFLKKSLENCKRNCKRINSLSLEEISFDCLFIFSLIFLKILCKVINVLSNQYRFQSLTSQKYFCVGKNFNQITSL